jgi:transposase
MAATWVDFKQVKRKCQVILLAAEGVPNNRIAQQTGLSRPTVIATRVAFVRDGVEAIRRRQRRKRSRRVLTAELEQKIVDVTLKTRPPDATHWSVRTLARQLGVSHQSPSWRLARVHLPRPNRAALQPI